MSALPSVNVAGAVDASPCCFMIGFNSYRGICETLPPVPDPARDRRLRKRTAATTAVTVTGSATAAAAAAVAAAATGAGQNRRGRWHHRDIV